MATEQEFIDALEPGWNTLLEWAPVRLVFFIQTQVHIYREMLEGLCAQMDISISPSKYDDKKPKVNFELIEEIEAWIKEHK